MDGRKLTTVFFGNNPNILRTLIENSDVLSVFCRKSDDASVESIINIANNYNIPVKRPSKKELFSYIDYLQNLKADFFLVCGYKYIIPKEIYSIPYKKTVNIHPSYLPNYRGQHVINWAIINGEKKTGVTFHLIDDGIDTGDIVIQKEIPIHLQDNALDLHDRIYSEASQLLELILYEMSIGKSLMTTKQNDDDASYFKPRTPEEGRINWYKSGIDIYNLIRGLSQPWPGAYGYVNEMRIVLWNASFIKKTISNSTAGQIINVSDLEMRVCTIDGELVIDSFEIYDTSNKIIHDYINLDGEIII